MTAIIYDIETYPNVFTFACINVETDQRFIYEVSQYHNDWPTLRGVLSRWETDKTIVMVGFNNIGFDNPIMLKMFQSHAADAEPEDIIATARYECTKIINTPFDQRFRNQTAPWKYRWPQLDLYKIHHFDNPARATSLKALEINMRSSDVRDLPYDPNSHLSKDEIQVLKEYNLHDVLETKKFYQHSLPMIELRTALVDTLGESVMNASDSKIGTMFFINRLSNESDVPLPKPSFTEGTMLHLNELIFDYVDFQRPEFQAIKEWLCSQSITQTKGVLTDIEEHNLLDVAVYSELLIKKKKCQSQPTQVELDTFKVDHPLGWIEEKPLKSGKVSYWKTWKQAKNLNVMVNGLTYIFGTGGLHASVENAIIKSDDDYQILDLDVASYYPNLSISNDLSPEHLANNFGKIYSDLYDERKQHAKGSPQNAILKISLNSVFGNLLNKYSPFYSPPTGLAITLNGQLLLCILVEELLALDDLKIIQANTDGISFKFKREDYPKVKKIYSLWEKLTGLELEETHYSSMYIRDVNNYLAIVTDGSVKRKGAYEYLRGWSQNQSMLVVRKAAEAHLVNGTKIADFIKNHDDPFDFYLATKVPRSSKLIMRRDDIDTPTQNTCRYYVSNTGHELIKIMPPLKADGNEREFQVEAGWLVTLANKVKVDGSMPTDLNLDYYIEQANKLVTELKEVHL